LLDGGRHLLRRKTHALGEEGDVDAPLVLGAQARRRAVDQELALAQAERALVEQAAGKHLGEHARAARHRAKQNQRRHALGHDALELDGDGGLVGRRGGGDARHEDLQ
jgi:hypothetical protein